MGRIKSTLIKRISGKLVKQHKQEFKEDFNYNKTKVNELAELHSVKLRNCIAGLVTKLIKKEKQQ